MQNNIRLWILPALFLLALVCQAASDRGAIQGTVNDPQGAVIGGVNITIVNTATNVTTNTTTNTTMKTTSPSIEIRLPKNPTRGGRPVDFNPRTKVVHEGPV